MANLLVNLQDETVANEFYSPRCDDSEEKIPKGKWLEVLDKNEQFDSLSKTAEASRLDFSKALYLSRIAKEEPDKVLEIICRVKGYDKYVKDHFTHALQKQPSLQTEVYGMDFPQIPPLVAPPLMAGFLNR